MSRKINKIIEDAMGVDVLTCECCVALAEREKNHGDWPKKGRPKCFLLWSKKHLPHLDENETNWFTIVEQAIGRAAIRAVANLGEP